MPVDFLLGSTSEFPQSTTYQPLDHSMPVLSDSNEASLFGTCCISACMYGGQQEYDLMAKSLSKADEILAKMLRAENVMVLSTINLTLTILHAHDQGPMAFSIIRSALHVAHDILGERDNISLTIEWMTAAAGRKLSTCRIKTEILRFVYTTFKRDYGAAHQHTIVALYNLSFQLILDKSFAEAEKHLLDLYETSKSTFGPSSMQTITALNTLSRAQNRQGKHQAAIDSLTKSLESHPLGPNHPHRLESMRRLALLFEKTERVDDMISTCWDVLSGRIKTLGQKHTFTQKAKEELVEVLKQYGRWGDEGFSERRIEELYREKSTELVNGYHVW